MKNNRTTATVIITLTRRPERASLYLCFIAIDGGKSFSSAIIGWFTYFGLDAINFLDAYPDIRYALYPLMFMIVTAAILLFGTLYSRMTADDPCKILASTVNKKRSATTITTTAARRPCRDCFIIKVKLQLCRKRRNLGEIYFIWRKLKAKSIPT